MPKDQVIYFDGAKWDYVLNNLYIPTDKDDYKRFKNFLEENKIEHTFDLFSNKYIGAFDDIKKEITESWKRIFEITDRSEFVVQANLWQIKKEWVRHIIRPGENFFKIVSDMEETWKE